MDSQTDPPPQTAIRSLRKIILAEAGQDVRRCRYCAHCNGNLTASLTSDSMDISLDTLVKLVLLNDDEVLTSKTLWSDAVYQSLVHACVQGLNLQAIVKSLREEALSRGISPQI